MYFIVRLVRTARNSLICMKFARAKIGNGYLYIQYIYYITFGCMFVQKKTFKRFGNCFHSEMQQSGCEYTQV